jgi:hypothetical protein
MQYGFQVLYGIGGGTLFPGRQIAIQASQPDADVPLATALSSTTISLGQAFGVAIGGVIFQNAWNQRISSNRIARLWPSQYVINGSQAEQSASLITGFPQALQAIYRSIMSDSINTVFIALAAFAAAATLVSLASENISLDRDSTSPQAFLENSDSATADDSIMPIVQFGQEDESLKHRSLHTTEGD